MCPLAGRQRQNRASGTKHVDRGGPGEPSAVGPGADPAQAPLRAAVLRGCPLLGICPLLPPAGFMADMNPQELNYT